MRKGIQERNRLACFETHKDFSFAEAIPVCSVGPLQPGERRQKWLRGRKAASDTEVPTEAAAAS